MFCCTLRCVHLSIAIILMGKRKLVALLNLSSWCLVMVERLFHAVPRGCLRFVIVVFPDYTHLLFFYNPILSAEEGLGAGGNVIITEIYLFPLPTIFVRHWFVRFNIRYGFANDEMILRTLDTLEKQSS